MDGAPDRVWVTRLAAARMARGLYLANLAATIAEGRDLRSSSTALCAEARLAYSEAERRRAAATAAWP